MSTPSTSDNIIDEINSLINGVLHGNKNSLDRLVNLGGDNSYPDNISQLCEYIAQLSIQSEVREFRLELIVEDLLQAQAEVAKANLDPLTGLPNRGIFHNKLETLCKSVQKDHKKLALLFIDLDYFKQVNDTYGHGVGDQVLKFLSQALKDNIRTSDYIARYGGEEFVIVLPQTNVEKTIQIAENLRKIINSLRFEVRNNSQTLKITCSFGISTFTHKNSNSTEVFNAADKALYQAKESGRDAIVVAKDEQMVDIELEKEIV